MIYSEELQRGSSTEKLRLVCKHFTIFITFILLSKRQPIPLFTDCMSNQNAFPHHQWY